MMHFKDYWDRFNIFLHLLYIWVCESLTKNMFFWRWQRNGDFFRLFSFDEKNVHMVILTWKILCFQHLYNMWFSVFFWKTWNQSEAGWENPLRDQCEIWGNWWEYRYIWGFWIEKNLVFFVKNRYFSKYHP